jgi:hypothetical protein
MIKEKRARAKTQTLSLRLDPKTRFVLEFVSRVRGQSITTAVERAIREAASNIVLEPSESELRNWIDFWDPDEGVRALKLLGDARYPTTFEEDELRAFALAHQEFFYANEGTRTPYSAYVNILWPRMDEFLSIWREERSTDYWAAGRAMANALEAADLSAPEWPRPTKETLGSFDKELDDEIPF